MSGLTFRSLIHFEFIFVYGVREGESGISAGVDWMRSCVKFDSWVRSGEACDPGWAPSGVNQLVEKYE